MSKTESAVPALDFKGADTIRALADAVKKDFKIGEGGVVQVDKDFYQKSLPEGLTMADVDRVQKHNTNFVSAVGLALGEVGIDHFKKHKKEDEISVDFVAGKDKVSLNFQRSKQFPDGKGGQLERQGVLSARWQVTGAGNRGSFAKVREHLSAKAAAAAVG